MLENKLKIFFTLFIFIFINHTVNSQNETFIYNQNKRKKIVVLVSKGGYTHISLLKIINDFIGDKYDIEPVYIFDKIFYEVKRTPIEKILIKLSKIKPEDAMCNEMFKKDRRKLINLGSSILINYTKRKAKPISKIIDDLIADPETIMLISLIAFINSSAMVSAKKRNIPFLIVTAESVLRNWLPNMPKPIYKNCDIFLAFNTPLVNNKLDKLKWPSAKRHFAALPIRKEFHKYDTLLKQDNFKELSKQTLNIDPKKFTLMILMGGTGSNGIINFVKTLANNNYDGHVIVVAGRNKKLLKRLPNIKLPKNMTATYLGFTNEISKYMAASDLLLTKPGPTTFYEAVHIELPLLIDKTKTVLDWEAPTIDIIIKNNLGLVLKRKRDLHKIIKDFQEKKDKIKLIKKSIRDYKKNIPDFEPIFFETFSKMLTNN